MSFVATDTTLRSTLIASKVAYLPHKPLVSLKADTSIVAAFETLSQHGIQSAPVYDDAKKAWIGLIDLKDFVAYVLEHRKNPNTPIVKVADLIGLSKGDQWLPVPVTWNIYHVLRRFYRTKFHRLPVVDENDPTKVLHMVSQSTLLRFLASKTAVELGDTMQRTVQDLDLGTKIGFVYCVMQSAKVPEVLQMLNHQGVWGCAVLNSHSVLIGNISVSDLKFVLSTEGGKLQLLKSMTAGELISKCAAVRPAIVTCFATDTLESVIKQLATHKVHRIYVVNSNKQPQGVITLTDIIELVARAADSRIND